MDLPDRRRQPVDPNTKTRGRSAERRALKHLRGGGLRLLERNFHCRFGEIDLIMREHACVVFVEVRRRSLSRFGNASQSVDQNKQRKLERTANFYISRNPGVANDPMRFDVVAIDGDEITWIRDAFRPGD